MGHPSVATIKRLFALSANRCAFPKCQLPLVEPNSGKVTGRICHIKARSPEGPRYDIKQSEQQRHAFENLLLMCPIHSDVIDSDINSYTVERLEAIKRSHESGAGPAQPLSDQTAQQMISNITIDNSTTQIALISSDQQTGGQTAQYIFNIGDSPWHPIKENVELSLLTPDQKLFKSFLTTLPSNGSIRFIDQQNMNGFSFDSKELDQLRDFIFNWADPEHEFIDVELEDNRATLFNISKEYLLCVTRNVQRRSDGQLSVPSEWEDEQPDQFHQIVEQLHALAGEVVAAHKAFVRLGRKKLNL